MITKEAFIKVIGLIKEEGERKEKFEKAIGEYGKCMSPVFESSGLRAAFELLKATIDTYDYVSWWLYENVDDKTVSAKDGSKSWNLDTVEKLYDFLIEENKENENATQC